MSSIQRQIRYESDRDLAFADEIRAMPGCELMDRCIQCATCSGVCPVSSYMEITPRRVIELTRRGFKQDVLNANTIWICTSCYECQVECPKEIGITDIMYALKAKAIEAGIEPKHFGPTVLFKEFFGMVKRTGRMSETQLAVRAFAKSNPLQFWGMKKLGIRLLRTGRFSVKLEHMPKTQPLKDALRHADPIDGRRKK